jgi:serine/threonine protein kinase
MSPEQAKDMGIASPRSNVYSLGVILYELLTGRVPRGRVMLPSQLNTEVPTQLDQPILKCITSRPEERYADIGEMKRRFAGVEDQLRVGLLHELQGLQRSTAKVFRRQEEPADVSTAIDVPRSEVEKKAPNKTLLIAIIAGALVVAVVVAILLLR